MPLKPLSFRVVERKLRAAGFRFKSQTGSHVKFSKQSARGEIVVIVPKHRRDIPIGILSSIVEQARLTVDEFMAF